MGRVADRNPRADSVEKSDAELVAELRVPDSDALGTLFRRYLRLVRRVAAGILRDAGEAEDVTQDVFLEIYRKAHLYDPARGPVRVWLLQYAYRRSLQRRKVLYRRAGYRGEPLDDSTTSPREQPKRLTRDECQWVIRRGLAQLTTQQRAAVELTCFEDASLRDVATQLRVSLGCARHYYYRGLARLRAWAQVETAAADPERRGSGDADGAPSKGSAARTTRGRGRRAYPPPRAASTADTAGAATRRARKPRART